MFLSNGFKKFTLYVVISTMLTVYNGLCNAASKQTINILTRHTYLRFPEIASAIKDKCGVEVSYDEFDSGLEAYLKYSKTAEDFYYYDIIIFPALMYELVKQKIAIKKSDLNNVVKEYAPDVKKHYLLRGYPGNVVYFALSLSGFVWNPMVIKISSNDIINGMFERAKNNIVIISNSTSSLIYLIDNDRKLPHNLFAGTFAKMIKDADVYITNGYNKLYDKNNFAFAFQRSGDAVSIMRKAKNGTLSFLVHPYYSCIYPDLMAELNTKPETRCAAKVLASKKILDIIQKETHYLSPYGTYQSVKDPIFRIVYQPLFSDIYKKIKWYDTYLLFATDIDETNKLQTMWDEIYALPQIRKNHSYFFKSQLGTIIK